MGNKILLGCALTCVIELASMNAAAQVGEIGSADWVYMQGVVQQQQFAQDMDMLMLQSQVQALVDEVRQQALDEAEAEEVDDE